MRAIWAAGGRGEGNDVEERISRSERFNGHPSGFGEFNKQLLDLRGRYSRPGLDPSLDVTARDRVPQSVDKFAALAVDEIHQLVLFATQDEDLLPLPAVETERRRGGIEVVERGEERSREERRREGQRPGGTGEVLGAVGEELLRRRGADDRDAERDARVWQGRFHVSVP